MKLIFNNRPVELIFAPEDLLSSLVGTYEDDESDLTQEEVYQVYKENLNAILEEAIELLKSKIKANSRPALKINTDNLPVLESLDRGEPVDHEQTQRFLDLLRNTPNPPDNSHKVILGDYVKKFFK